MLSYSLSVRILGMSDHGLIYIIRKQRLPKSRVKVTKSRGKNHFNQNAFLADVATTRWDTAFIFDGIDDVWAHWHKLFNQTIQKNAPFIKKESPVKSAPVDQCKDKESYAIEKKVAQNNIVATQLKTYGTTIGT